MELGGWEGFDITEAKFPMILFSKLIRMTRFHGGIEDYEACGEDLEVNHSIR